MYADLDELVLSGRLFNPQSRSPSPQRSPASDEWPDINEEEDDEETAHEKRQIDRILASKTRDGPVAGQSIGLGPGRTGVKGVIRDQAEVQQYAKGQSHKTGKGEIVGGMTFLEEENEKELERMMLEGLDISITPKSAGRFGHLREVGMAGFVNAVEKEARGVWVVVHLYEPSLERCYEIDGVLTRLARLNTSTKFVRTRAAALGFASKTPSSRRLNMPGRLRADDDSDAEEEDDEDDDVDLDVLPTMLVYRDGELVHNWVRVDWEAGKAGIEDLLRRNNILSSEIGTGTGNCGLPSDDEDSALEFDDD